MPNRVLVVDDSSYARLYVKQLLEEHGFEVVGTAENTSQAVELYQKFKPDVVTMDVVMPGANGLEAIKVLKGIDPKAQIVVISVLQSESAAKQARELGVSAFVGKPVEWEKLQKALSSALTSN